MSLPAQTDFAAALRDPDRSAPKTLAWPDGSEPARRFAVYRNNVMVSLVSALETRFPAARRIVGEAFFARLARAYAFENPPRSPVMATYGDDFADFVALEPGLEELPYLADVIRLEAARTRAYHAADREPLGPAAFATLDHEALDRLMVEIHPSVEIVRSPHPVVGIWAMNAGEAELGPIEDWIPQDALIARPALDVVVRELPPGGATFLVALGHGRPLGGAAQAAQAETQDFDLSLNLVGLIEAGLATSFTVAGDRSAQ